MRALALLLLGMILGLLGAIVQAQRVHIGSVTIPIGMLVALGVLVPICRAAAWWMRSRFGGFCLAIGWLIATLAMGTSSPWDDLVIDSGLRQMAYLVLGSLLLAASATFPLIDREAAKPTTIVVDTAAEPLGTATEPLGLAGNPASPAVADPALAADGPPVATSGQMADTAVGAGLESPQAQSPHPGGSQAGEPAQPAARAAQGTGAPGLGGEPADA